MTKPTDKGSTFQQVGAPLHPLLLKMRKAMAAAQDRKDPVIAEAARQEANRIANRENYRKRVRERYGIEPRQYRPRDHNQGNR